uniref:OBP47-like domain-containing protein n=1 Tax=Phlebotomus papatasi TaxID=29031 RepID=A0A1B0CYN4_PHLPP
MWRPQSSCWLPERQLPWSTWRTGLWCELEAYNHSVVNTYFKKKDDHLITYKSGNTATQIDFITCNRDILGKFKDCKVIPGEPLTTQHRLLVADLKVVQQRHNRVNKGPPKIRKLPETYPKQCCQFPMPLDDALVESCMEQYGAQTIRVMEFILSGGPLRGGTIAEGMPEWELVIESAITQCAGIVKELGPQFDEAVKLPPLDPADPICTAAPGFMLFCIEKILFNACPAK